MGFITTGQTDVVVYLTHIGAQYLAGKKTSPKDLIIKYFTLGDSDTDYLVKKRNQQGYIPDLTGENTSCLKIVNSNIKTSGTVNDFHKSIIYKKDDNI